MAELADHVFATESDRGAFRPLGIRLVGTPAAVEQVAGVGRLLAAGVPSAGLDVDGSRYFWYHHTTADTPDTLDPAGVARCVATFAVWADALADAPGRPAHGAPAAGR